MASLGGREGVDSVEMTAWVSERPPRLSARVESSRIEPSGTSANDERSENERTKLPQEAAKFESSPIERPRPTPEEGRPRVGTGLRREVHEKTSHVARNESQEASYRGPHDETKAPALGQRLGPLRGDPPSTSGAQHIVARLGLMS